MIKRRAGRKKGTKPLLPIGGSYNTGDPAINLCLAVLAHAKRDAFRAIPKVICNKYQEGEKAFILSGRRMWHAFQDSGFYGKKVTDPSEVAWWVCAYIKRVRNV